MGSLLARFLGRRGDSSWMMSRAKLRERKAMGKWTVAGCTGLLSRVSGWVAFWDGDRGGFCVDVHHFGGWRTWVFAGDVGVLFVC